MLSNDIFTNSVHHFSLYFKENDSVREEKQRCIHKFLFFPIQFFINYSFLILDYTAEDWQQSFRKRI